jgi:iron-sulfur cluster assembly accessory protein
MIKSLFSTVRKFPITITNGALNKMSEIIKKQNAVSFVFSAVTGGCNGLNYNLKLLDKDKYTQTYDTYSNNGKIKPTMIEKNNVKILIDPISEMFLLGTTIDYVSEDYVKGIFENKFVFIPDKKLATSCGCGISFTPKN